MIYEFRELTREDIPAIAEIASYMPSFFQNILEYAESLMDNPDCYYFGMFQDSTLLGVGNLRRKTAKFAWLESVRVAPNNQQKGIGTALFNHGVQKAKEENFPIIAYATDVNNQGSCSIGKKLGFKLVAEMKPLWIKIDDQKLNALKKIEQKPISIDEAIDLLNNIPNPPIDEISLGWKYAPLDKEYLTEKLDMRFYVIEKTILLEFKDRDMNTNEIHSTRAIIYGSKKHVKELLLGFLYRNASQEYLYCNIDEKLEHIPKELGFANSIESENLVNKVVLWKLKLD